MSNSFRTSLVDVHGNYRGGRIAHKPPDELITDVVSARTLRPHITRAVVFFVLFVVTALGWLLMQVLVLADRISNFGSDTSFGSFASGMSTLLGVGLFVVGLAWFVSLFLPLREEIAEYSVLVENRAHAFPFVYSWIADTVLARRSPFELRFGRVRGVPVLLVANGRVRGMVSVRQVGTDLFLGWHMWRNRSTLTMIGHLIRDMFQRGQAWAPVEVVRSGWAAAMRELLHSVTREGAQAAMLDSAPAGFHPAVRIEALEEIDLNVPPAPATPPLRPRPAPPVPGGTATARTDPMPAHLTRSDGSRVWAWTGVEVTAAHDLTKIADYARLDPPRRLEHAVAQQRSYLERLLSLESGDVVALRIAANGAGRVRIVLLGRTSAGSGAQARVRADRLADRLADVPPLVSVAVLDDPHELHRMLAPFVPAPAGIAQIGKRSRLVAATRIDAGVTHYAAVEPFSRRLADWTPLIGAFRTARTPAALTVSLSPQVVSASLRHGLERESVRLAHVSTPLEMVADLGGRLQQPPDAAAAVLAPIVADALDRYTGPAFRFGATLTSPGPLDPILAEAVAGVLSLRPDGSTGHHDPAAVISGYVIRPPADAQEGRMIADAVASLEPIAVPDPVLDHVLARDADRGRHGLRELQTIVDSIEAASVFRLPLALDGTLPGFPVRTPPGRFQVLPPVARESLLLGHQGDVRTADAEVRIATADLARHAFIVGTPGSGKTNSALHLCSELWRNRVPFLVVEPVNTALDDYRWLATRPGFEDLLVLTVGDESVAPLRLNPFEVPLGSSVDAHVSNLLACFEAAFGLWDPLPFLYRRALLRTYLRRGFHPDDRARPEHVGRWPVLSEFVTVLAEVTSEPGYSGETRDNIDAAARLRAEALAEGACATTLDTRRSLDIGELLRRPVVVGLAGVGDNAKEQALVTLLLLTAVRGHRRSSRAAASALHVLLIEEAHRVFPRTRPASSGEAKEADARALAAERLAQGLAEDRKYRQGYVLIDQQVGAVAEDAYKVTNLKIMHRTAAEEDRQLLGSTMSMSEDQVATAASLAPFEALVSHNGLDRAVHVRVPDVRAEDARQRGLPTRSLDPHDARHGRRLGGDRTSRTDPIGAR